MRRLSLDLALLAIASGVNGSASPQPSNVVTDTDSYAIYAERLPSDRPVALLEETRRAPVCPGIGQLTSEWKELHDSFQAANVTTHSLMPQLFDGARGSIEFVSVQRLLELIRAVDPKPGILHDDHAVYQSFPGEKLLAFSAVGFNADRTLAMVAVQQNCGVAGNGRGGSCEGGYTTVLQKDQNGWHSAQVTPSPLRCAWAS